MFLYRTGIRYFSNKSTIHQQYFMYLQKGHELMKMYHQCVTCQHSFIDVRGQLRCRAFGRLYERRLSRKTFSWMVFDSWQYCRLDEHKCGIMGNYFIGVRQLGTGHTKTKNST